MTRPLPATETILGWLTHETRHAVASLAARPEPSRWWAERAIRGRRWRITIETDPTGIPERGAA